MTQTQKTAGFSATNPANHKGQSNTWLTPLELVRALGDFDLDPCGFPEHWTASAMILPPEDGLKKEWYGRVWLNPPYGKEVVQWLDKLHHHGNGIALVFARTDTTWFQKHMGLCSSVLLIAGRISFLNEKKQTGHNAGTGSALFAYGRKNADALRRSGIKGYIA